MSCSTTVSRLGILSGGILRRVGANRNGYTSCRPTLTLMSKSMQMGAGQSKFTRSLHSGSGNIMPENAVVEPPTDTTFNVSIHEQSSLVGDGDAGAGNGAVESLEHLPSATLGPIGSIFSNSPPVLAAEDLLTQLHDLPGMDWTKSIILTTFGIRLLVGLPLTVFQQKSMAKLENLQPQFKQLAADLNRETSIAAKLYNWSERKSKSAFKASFKRHWRNLVEENNCHPLRAMFLIWLQVPFWVCFSSALRNIVYIIPEPRTSEMLLRWMQMAAENPGWIESLASVDHFILPAVFLSANLINIQINSMRKLAVPQTTLQKVIPWVFRGGVVGISVLAAFTPSAVTMYWATSSVLALVQNLLMKAPAVRRFFRIPASASNP